MRILHTSDWHLGRTLHGVPVLEHQIEALGAVAQIARRESVDAILVSGDIYDQALPSVAVVSAFEDALVELSEICTVVITSGNHDSAVRLGVRSRLMGERTRVVTDTRLVGTPVEVEGRDGERALIYPLPYLQPDEARHTLAREPVEEGEPPALLPRSHEAVVGAAMDRVRRDLAQRRAAGDTAPAVVMAHAFIVGGEVSDSENPIVVGGVDSVPAGVFAGVDYVALGHLHGPQRVELPESARRAAHEAGRRDPVARYSGSLLAYSFSEARHVKSVTVVDLDAKGVRGEPQVFPLPVPRPLTELTGTLEDLLSDRHAGARDHWVKLTVTDQVLPVGWVGQLKAVFPHQLVVQRAAYAWEAPKARAVEKTSDPVEVTCAFVSDVRKSEPSEAERHVIEEAFERVRSSEVAR